MTVCAPEVTTGDRGDKGEGSGRRVGGRTAGRAGCVISADGAYAARLTLAPGTANGWFPERWTLDGPEPYAVPLPGSRPEHPASQVLPLADGRVLIARRVERRHQLALLYPAGPGTGEAQLGSIDAERLTLLPPAPGGRLAYALVQGAHSATVWLVAGGACGPQQVAAVSGRCSGGAWLDREGRLLAVDRTQRGPGAGPGARTTTKTVAIDLMRGGETTPLLQIAEGSDDRLLLTDPDSGLLLVRSDAPNPGEDRLGWGVLGSHRPVRFPEVLRPEGVRLTPFALQPGQALQPENCAVALRAEGPNGTWITVWQPGQRKMRHIAAPDGWLSGAGLWTAAGELRLPYGTAQTACGVARVRTGVPEGGSRANEAGAGVRTGAGAAAGVNGGRTGSGGADTAAGSSAAATAAAAGAGAAAAGAAGCGSTDTDTDRTGEAPSPPRATAAATAGTAVGASVGAGTGATPPGGTPRPVPLRQAPIAHG